MLQPGQLFYEPGIPLLVSCLSILLSFAYGVVDGDAVLGGQGGRRSGTQGVEENDEEGDLPLGVQAGNITEAQPGP